MAKNKSPEGRAPSQRQLRVGELIRRTLSEVLSRGELHDPELNRMSITVGEVRVTPDLRIATAYVLPQGGLCHLTQRCHLPSVWQPVPGSSEAAQRALL